MRPTDLGKCPQQESSFMQQEPWRRRHGTDDVAAPGEGDDDAREENAAGRAADSDAPVLFLWQPR